MAIYRSIRRFAQIYRVTIVTMYFNWATQRAAPVTTKETFAVSLQPQILRYHLQGYFTEKQISRERKSDLKFEIWPITPTFMMLNARYIFGSDYFTENFQVKENKTKLRNIHPRFFHLLF